MLQKAKVAYAFWLAAAEHVPRVHRYGIRSKVEFYFLELLELIFTALYLPVVEKSSSIEAAIYKLNNIKFFLQLCWENKLVSNGHYLHLTENLDELGRILGGWRNGIKKKTLAVSDERKPRVSGRMTR